MGKERQRSLNDFPIRTRDYILFGVVTAFLWIFFIHPDIMETSNHSYLLLDGIFHGRFSDFYESVRLHDNALYYVNNAHYNIFIYLLFALWQLPVYLVNLIFSLPMNETFFFIWTKGLCVLSYLGCVFMLYRVCRELDLGEKQSKIAAFAFLINPISYFISVVMGQYDTFCLFFILWALLYYIRGDMTRFAILIGVASLGKFFAFFILVPLILLREKRILHILKLGAIAVAPYLLTALIFRGSDTSPFLLSMMERPFETTVGGLSVFLTLYLTVCVLCFLRKEEKSKKSDAIYISLLVYGLLFLLITIHPQWMMLFVPFWVIAVFLQKNRQIYYYIATIASGAFSLFMFQLFSNHFEVNLLGFGVLRLFGNTDIAVHEYPAISHYLSMIPLFGNLARYLFPAMLFIILLLRLPFKKDVSLADGGQYETVKNEKRAIWIVFALGMGFWLSSVMGSLLLSFR